MMVYAQHGPIGPAGMVAVPLVMEELNYEPEIVKMGSQVIARDQSQICSSVINIRVNQEWFTGVKHRGIPLVGVGFMKKIFPLAKL